LQFLKRKLNLTHEFYKGWKDALIGGEEIYYIGVINGDPYVERVNPMYFDYEHSLDLEFIDDAAWCLCYNNQFYLEIMDSSILINLFLTLQT
jgi:hypothetical protein